MDLPQHVKDQIHEVLDKWQKKHISPQGIQKQVLKFLDDKSNERLYQILGFNKWGGKWEIDHCNGRMCTVDNALREIATPLAIKWVLENLENLDTPTVEMRRCIKVAYERQFMRVLEARAQAMAEEHAKSLLDSTIRDIVQEKLNKPLV